MRTLFADAGFWIALWSPTDLLHERAVEAAANLENAQVVTSLPVLFEAVDFFSRRGDLGRPTAARAAQALFSSANVEIVPETSEQVRAALERYADRPDQRWSLTDCASFLVMEERDITEALAYDRDFEQAGFTALLRSEPA